MPRSPFRVFGLASLSGVIFLQLVHVDRLGKFQAIQVHKNNSSTQPNGFDNVSTSPIGSELAPWVMDGSSVVFQYQIPFFEIPRLNFLVKSPGNPALIALNMVQCFQSALVKKHEFIKSVLLPICFGYLTFSQHSQRRNFNLDR